MRNSFKSWWWNSTHVPPKPPSTLGLLKYHLGILEETLQGCLGDVKPLEVRMRYKDAVAFRKKKIEEIGFKAPTSLEELENLRSWIVDYGPRHGR